MVKTRILLSTKNSNVPSTFTTVVKYIWKNAGIKGFYQGLSAAFMREAVYGTARLGIFDSLSESGSDSLVAKGMLRTCGWSLGRNYG